MLRPGEDDAAAEQEIKSAYGNEYHKYRQFKNKNSSAQEAHEAIRPTNFSVREVTAETDEEKLYQLICKIAL